MKQSYILALSKLGNFIRTFLSKDFNDYNETDSQFNNILNKSKIDNPWFSIENQKYALGYWGNKLTINDLNQWQQNYSYAKEPKKIGLVLAGNIPLVGFHDVISVILSGNIPIIKLSSKDRLLIPFLLNKLVEFSDKPIPFEIVEKLTNYDAVIATGSNNTARYLEYYFKDTKKLIRKNRTSVAVLDGNETDEDIRALARDIFRYFGLGCRNVTRLFIPQNFGLERLFENFMDFKEVINHHKYANNYDYNRAIYLLNQEKFWDNNFVLLKEDTKLFSPLGVIHFSRYNEIGEVAEFLEANTEDIQCVVASDRGLLLDGVIPFGEAQCPLLDTYADNVDTMRFLEEV